MEPINDSPNENNNIIIKFKLSDIKHKPKSLSESEQQNSQNSKEISENDDESNFSYQSNEQQQSSESELQSFEKDLQNNLKCREEQMIDYNEEDEVQEEKIEKKVKTDQETKQSNSLLYSHDKTNQKNQKRSYLKQNQHVKESYVDLPVSKERMLQLSLESAQKFQQKLLYTNIVIRPFIKMISENYEKGDEMTCKEGFPANSIPFLIVNEKNNQTRYYQNGALQAQQTTVEKFINLNTQGDKDGISDRINYPGSYLGYSNFMRKRRKRRSHAQILSDNLAKLQEESQKKHSNDKEQQLQLQHADLQTEQT